MNRATKIIVATSGVILGISGLVHGRYLWAYGIAVRLIDDMGQRWFYGTEQFLSSVPNMIRTGILTMGVSIAIMFWSVWFVQKVFGPTVLLLPFMLRFLLEGSIGQVDFSIPIWLVAT